jgi:hypothetical protein
VRLSPLGTPATNWPIVPAPDDRWWVWRSRRNENWQGKPKYSEKTCPSATLPDLGSNAGCCGVKPATNSLSYGTTRAPLLVFYSSETSLRLHHTVWVANLTDGKSLSVQPDLRYKDSGSNCIWEVESSEKSTYRLLGCNAMLFVENPTFRKNLSPPSSWSKNEPGRKPAAAAATR